MSIQKYFILFLVCYIIILAGLVIYLKFKDKKSKRKLIFSKTADFYLSASKPLGIPVLILTFAATLFSAFFMVGIPGFLFTHGLLTWPYVIFGDVLGMLGLFYVGKKIIENGVKFGKNISPLEVILKTPLSKIVFITGTTVFILPYLAVQIGGFGKLIESATQGAIPFLVASAVGLAIIYLYSLLLGIRGIAISDLIQGVLLFGCAIFVGYHMTYVEFDGASDLINTVYNYNPNLFSVQGAKGVFSLGALISGCILFAALPITQPQFLTRYMLIEKEKSVFYLKSIALGMGTLIAVGALVILPVGLGGAVQYPDLNNGDLLIGSFLNDSLPAWFGGLFTIGVLAAAMSTADSILFSLGQMFSRDIYKGIISPNASGDREMFIGKTFILLIAIVAFIISLGNLELIVTLSSLSFSGTLQLAPAVIGGLWLPKAWKHSSTLSIIIGMVSLFFFRNNNPLAILNLNPAIASLILSSLTYYLTARFIRD